MIQMSQIRIPIDVPVSELENSIKDKIAGAAGIKKSDIKAFRIVKESVDARKKPKIIFTYTVEFEYAHEDELLKRAGKKRLIKNIRTEKKEKIRYIIPSIGHFPNKRPIVAGFGPCGIFAALILAEAGFGPVVIERGRPIDERVRDVELFWNTGELNTESNVQFGEGGAGTFSDGKLTTGIKDIRISKVNSEFAEAGADPSILYKHMPHIGTDVLRVAVKNIREKIISLGGEIYFETKLTGLVSKNGRLTGIKTEKRGTEGVLSCAADCERAVLAPGNSSRDTFRMLYGSGIALEIKPFSVGVRIEHLQSMINASQYGEIYADAADTEICGGRLSAAVYKLSHRCGDGRGVYTFCMCPGGYVTGAASEYSGVVTNGMSDFARDGENANSALLVEVRPEDCYEFTGKRHPLAGIELQERLERLAFDAGLKSGAYFAPAQTAGDFLYGDGSVNTVVPTYRPGIRWTDISKCLPDFAVNAMREALPEMGKKLKGFDTAGAVLTAVETRSSSPVRIIRGENRESVSLSGLYPGGEGAGYAGGIMSAAVDGIKIAECIIDSYR